MTTERAPSEQLSIAQHPDILALRERYERAAETEALDVDPPNHA
jgi:hypothetical protein